MADICKNIKRLRLQKNMNQTELAEALGVTRQTVSNWERGSSYPDIAMVERLSQVLDSDLDGLLYPQKPQTSKAPRENPFTLGFVVGSSLLASFLILISQGYLLLPVLFGYIALCAAMICDHLSSRHEMSTVEWLDSVLEKKSQENQEQTP